MTDNETLRYELQHTETSGSTGFFSCRPQDGISFQKALGYLRSHSFDSFMHDYLLAIISGYDQEQFRHLLAETAIEDVVVRALLCEACLSFDLFSEFIDNFSRAEARRLAAVTPSICIRSALLEDRPDHYRWIQLLRENVQEHKRIPVPGEFNPLVFPDFAETAGRSPAPRSMPAGEKAARLQPEEIEAALNETASRAGEALSRIGVLEGGEKRHVASLSPIALLRKWRFSLTVRIGRHHYDFFGLQTSYGRGLTLSRARASCLMEIVERCSSFASFDEKGIRGFRNIRGLQHGAFHDLSEKGWNILDPNRICLEVPYEAQKLYWVEAHGPESRGPVLIPVQCVFLFCNLDEPDLFSGLGSTGLASGNTAAEAKLSGLLEVLERDSEGTVPYDPAHCFRLVSDDPQVSDLLEDYRGRGIQVQFQDLRSIVGIPCYKCFVVDVEGRVVRGTAAHLSGRRAVLSALTETAYPYPYGPPSGWGPVNLPVVRLEDLPDFTSGGAEADLNCIEGLLHARGYDVLYVDCTREDLGIPVFRTLVPGLEIAADFDRYSRVNPRLYQSYLKMLYS